MASVDGDPGPVIIRPGVSVLALFRHLNYKPWFAVAEFVDNSLQSFLGNRPALQSLGTSSLVVEIELETNPPGRLVVRDNAAGILASDYARAFKPAAPPSDRTGLAEFGIGMKSAACWFSDSWAVRSKGLGERVERSIEFDIPGIVAGNVEEIEPSELPATRNDHFTEITLRRLDQQITPKTVGKIKDHLASIYRRFELSGTLRIKFNGEILRYEPPAVLIAPYYGSPGSAPVTWRRNLEFELDPGVNIKGWAAIRAVASTSLAGFALFRRGRLIVGSADETYRPPGLFGRSNSYTYQRLFGEFELGGIEVTHTKDGFQWEGYEETFLTKLRTELNQPQLPILAQAEGYRARAKTTDIAAIAQAALESASLAIVNLAPPILDGHSRPVGAEHLPQGLQAIPLQHLAALREFQLTFHGTNWRVKIDFTNDPGVGEWLTVTAPTRLDGGGAGARRELAIRLSLAHPFVLNYVGPTEEGLEPVVRIAIALALGEVVAREAGVRNPSVVRDTVNDLLRNALSLVQHGELR